MNSHRLARRAERMNACSENAHAPQCIARLLLVLILGYIDRFRASQKCQCKALRREWQALFKDSNAAVAFLKGSLRARREAAICVVVLA